MFKGVCGPFSCAAIRAKRDAALVAFVNDNIVLSTNFPSWFDPHDSNQILANAQQTGTDINAWYTSGTPYSQGSAGGMVKVRLQEAQLGGTGGSFHCLCWAAVLGPDAFPAPLRKRSIKALEDALG